MAEDLGTGSLTITLDDTATVAAADRLGDRIARILDQASRDAGLRIIRNISRAIDRINPVVIRVEADTTEFRRVVGGLTSPGNVSVGVVPDIDRASFLAAVEAALAGLEVSIRVVPDLSDFDAAIRAHNAPSVRVNVEADRSSIGRLGSVLGKLGGALGGIARLAGATLAIGALGIAAAGSVVGVVALTAALAPAVGLLAAGPAVILGFQAALGALKLALSGVGDAFGAALTGDAEEFEKALKALSPAAQAAAREVRALRPAFDGLKRSVQDAFFTQITGEITKTAQALGGPLRSGLTRISTAWGQAAKGALDYVQSSKGVADVKNILDASALGVEGLAKGTGKLTEGFLSVAAAVSKSFGPRLSQGINNATTGIGNFLTRSAESGQATAWVQGAIDVLKQLGGVLANVGKIIGGVFRAANDVGGGFLNNLKEITGSFSEFVNSAKGQEAIGNIFKTLSAVAAQLGPILGALVTQLGAIAPALAPLFLAIGPALVSLISALGPAIQGILPGIQSVVEGLVDAIGQIADSGALQAIGTALGEVLSAIAPLLPVVGQLVASLGIALAPVLSALVAALSPVISAIADALTPILPPLTEAFVTLATAVTPLLTLIGSSLAGVIASAAPLLLSLATTLGTIATAAEPLIAQITEGLVPVFQTLLPVIDQLVAAFIPLVTNLVDALLPVLPPVVDALLALLVAVVPLIPPVAELTAQLLTFTASVVGALAPALEFAANIVSWTTITVVVPIIDTVVSALNGIVGVISDVIGAASTLVSSLTGHFSTLGSNVSGLVSSMVASVTGFFSALWSQVTSRTSAGVAAVTSLFSTLPGRARGAIASLPGAVTGVFNSAAAAATSRVSSLISQVQSLLSQLPGRARSALSGISGALVSAGADMMRGFINGIQSQAGRIANAALAPVKNAVAGVKNFLGISSPSKLLAEIGKFTGQGFIKGLQGTEADIERAADQVVAKIRDAFKGKNSRLDDALIRQVRATEKQLLKLADRREAIAAKIKKANELAVSVTQEALQSFSLAKLSESGGGIEGLTEGVDQAIAKVRDFNKQVNALAKRGLRKDLLAQLIGLGPDQGAALADTLSRATGSQLKDLNEAQKQLAAASKKLGRDSADNLFDAGKQASKGFLAGLKAQQKDVENLMLSLARAMAKAIRSALGIKSPSTVFRRVGNLTMDGLSLGVEDRIRSVRQSVLGAASAITEPFGASPALGTTGTASGRQAGIQGRSSSGGRSLVINQTINEVGDARATAERIIGRLAVAGGL